jgi:hypothetical protein
VGNIASGSDEHKQVVLNLSALPVILDVLDSPKMPVRREACAVIANIAAGTTAHVQALISQGAFTRLVRVSQRADRGFREQTALAIANAVSRAHGEQIRRLVDEGCLEPICDVLNEASSISGTMAGLDAVDSILRVGGKHYIEVIESSGALDKIERLQTHSDEAVYKKTFYLLETFFAGDEDMEESDQPSMPVEAGSFSFGTVRDALP